MKPLQIVFKYARNYKAALVVTVVSMILLVGVRLLIPWIIKLMITAVTAENASQALQGRLLQLTLLALGLYVLRAVLQFLRSYVAHVAGWGVVADARKHIYEHVQRLSPLAARRVATDGHLSTVRRVYVVARRDRHHLFWWDAGATGNVADRRLGRLFPVSGTVV